jgi:hypothetical protein
MCNYFMPLSIRQDASAFRSRKAKYGLRTYGQSNHDFAMVLCCPAGNIRMGLIGAGADTQFTLVHPAPDQSRDR